jgi:hypothetical protein
MRTLAPWLLLLCLITLPACSDGGHHAAPDASTDAADASEPDDGAPYDGSWEPPVLRSIPAATAVELAQYARKTRTLLTGSQEMTQAWSMVNDSCIERALLLDWVIASAPATLAGSPAAVVRTEDLTGQRIDQLIASPTYDSAVISIAGPLVAEQTILAPGGTAIPGDPLVLGWPYHFGAIVAVDGVEKVMDLSVGDTPLEIDAWAHSFVDPAEPCYLMDDDEFFKVWAYWMSVTSNWVPDARPPRVCGYQVYPFMRTRGDQPVTAEQINTIPWTLETQHGSFVTTLGEHGVTPTDADIPRYLSAYQPLTEVDICRIWDFVYCH